MGQTGHTAWIGSGSLSIHTGSATRKGQHLLLQKVRFYQASSTFRIARNGWLPRLERTDLVAQALALLA